MVRRSRAKNVNFETIPDGEAEQIQEVTDLTVKILDMRYGSKGQPALRQVHPKSHGCVKATFEIRDDLDKSLAVGLFAQPGRSYDALILAVAHQQFADLGADGIRRLGAPNSVIYDVKHALPRQIVDARL